MSKCFVCGKKLKEERAKRGEGLTWEPLSDGLWFRSAGNYGSTIFDPMMPNDHDWLEIAICDECVLAKQKEITVIMPKRTVTPCEFKSFEQYRKDEAKEAAKLAKALEKDRIKREEEKNHEN